MSIVSAFERAKLNKTGTFAILEKDEKITFENILNQADRLSLLFKDLNLAPGAKIVLSTTDKKSFAEILLSAYRCGLTVLLIDPNTSIQRCESICSTAIPDAFFLDDVLFEKWNISLDGNISIKKVKAAKTGLFNKVFKKEALASDDKHYPAVLEKYTSGGSGYPDTIPDQDTAYIIFTSGTTSNPKGVEISYKALFSHMHTLEKVYQLEPKSAIFNNLNLFHADGSNQGPLLAFTAGCTWVSSVEIDVTKLSFVASAIYKHRISHYVTVPTILAFLEKYIEGYEDSFQTEDFKYIISVAAQLDPVLWEKTEKLLKVPIANVYGLTETVNGSIYAIPGTPSHKIGTIGKPVDCEIKIVDAAGIEATAGELLIKGDHLMKGYYKNITESNAVLQQGWLHTGDVAERDADGCIKIVGRIKRMINSGGFRIHPEEIEEVLMGIQGIQEAIIIGLDDTLMVEKMVAFVVPEENVTLSINDIYKKLRAVLEQEKIPAEILIKESLPKNAGGKTDLTALKNYLSSPTVASKNFNDLDQNILSIAAAVFKIELSEINLDSTPGSLAGWDSLNHFVLITDLEDKYNLTLTTQDIMSMESMGAICNLVKRKLR
jgi:acyl-CoA synthetase (AMP-forming)/AMP-acid ligase II/acyl carrier protein